MRKTRGVLFVLVGLVLAGLAAYTVMNYTKQAAANAAAAASAAIAARQEPVAPTPIPKVYVVMAAKDLPENVALSGDDVTTQEFPADLAPPGAIASTDIAIGKYTTTRIFKGEVLVAPLLSATKQSSALAANIPDGKVAVAVEVNDAMNALGALRPGDRVDILLTLDLRPLLAVATPQAGQPGNQQANQQAAGSSSNTTNPDQNPPQLSTQLTMQNVEILAIGATAGDAPTGTSSQTQMSAQVQTQQEQARARTITFLLDHQDAITLKFIKDSGGTMDLAVRAPTDEELAKTDAVTLDTIYRKYTFRFVKPVGS
jgi:pilus assembly protein CpaB